MPSSKYHELRLPPQPQQQKSLFGPGIIPVKVPQLARSAPQHLHTNINDVSAYGTSSLFAYLALPTMIKNPGPLLIPLPSSTKPKKAPISPTDKLKRPPSAFRFETSPKRGLGFSYSTYGTPKSIARPSTAPPHLGKGLGRSLYDPNLSLEDSILAPGAFSASSSTQRYRSPSTIKKLVMNRELINDLFSPPLTVKIFHLVDKTSLTKRVSFDDGLIRSAKILAMKIRQFH